MVKLYDLWGPIIGSIEGDECRTHRRMITAGFNPSTNTAVWREAIYQTQTLIEHWSEEGSVIPVTEKWTSQVALLVISGVFFHKRLQWNAHETEPSTANSTRVMSKRFSPLLRGWERCS